MRSWGIPLRNGALLGAGLLSAAAVYLFITGQMTWVYGAWIVVGVILCVGVGLAATHVAALMELLEESQQSESEIQRKLVDILTEIDQISLVKLAETVEGSVENTSLALHNLIDLRLFAGAVAWDSSTVYPRQPGYLAGLEACLHCGEPILLEAGRLGLTCPICRAQHADILTPND